MPRFKQVRVPAVEGIPNAGRDRLRVYTAELPAELVAQFRVERALDVEGGFQRPLDAARARKIGLLMGGNAKREQMPEPNVHGALLAFADPEEVEFRGGKLTIKNPLRLLDGQTRAGGDKWAVENGSVHDYTESVKIVIGATRRELVRWFLLINMTARKNPPENVLLNIGQLSGSQNNRKSWIARHAMTLSSVDPFYIGETRLVKWSKAGGGVISPYTLYKAINFMLPDDLNKEGDEVEEAALRFATEGFKLYASLYGDRWIESDGEGNLVKHDWHEFTLMAAFARLYKGAVAELGVNARVDTAIRKAWHKSELDKGLPESSGSGERAAAAIASYVANEMHLKVGAVAA